MSRSYSLVFIVWISGCAMPTQPAANRDLRTKVSFAKWEKFITGQVEANDHNGWRYFPSEEAGLIVLPDRCKGTNNVDQTRFTLPRRLISDDVYDDFIALHQAALEECILLYPCSTFRSLATQQGIWNHKAGRGDSVREIAQYSAIPGTSGHHCGEMDVIDPAASGRSDGSCFALTAESYTEGGVYARLGDFLKRTVGTGDPDKSRGFYQPYCGSRLDGEDQIQPEPWHIGHRELMKRCRANYTRDLFGRTLDMQPNLRFRNILKARTDAQDFYAWSFERVCRPDDKELRAIDPTTEVAVLPSEPDSARP